MDRQGSSSPVTDAAEAEVEEAAEVVALFFPRHALDRGVVELVQPDVALAVKDAPTAVPGRPLQLARPERLVHAKRLKSPAGLCRLGIGRRLKGGPVTADQGNRGGDGHAGSSPVEIKVKRERVHKGRSSRVHFYCTGRPG